jgi:glycosyltransferase involved in cell wall biosynthesis
MRVSFDGLTITARPAGVGGTALRLLTSLARAPGPPEIVAVLPRGSAADAEVAGLANVSVIRAPVDGPDTPRALWFQHAVMPRLLRGAAAAVHVGPAFVLPLRRSGAPEVVVFHDAAWRRFPDTKSARFRTYMDVVVPRSLRRAAAVVAVSEFARGEALAVGGADVASRTCAIPWGVDPPQPGGGDPGVPRPYLLCVSNFDRRKNLPALVEAWRRLRRDPAMPHALVLVGDAGRARELRDEVAVRADEPLVTPGYVAPERLAALYRGAAAVVVPSLYEGFGLPVLEAFAAGAPVACARAASLPEVAGGAAVLFDPADADDIARAVAEAARGDEAARRRVEAGAVRAAEFTWRRTAEAWLALLRRVTSSRDRA